MDLNLKNKNILVTGGAHGIGLGIAKVLNEEGANVIICSRSVPSSEVKSLGLDHFQVDVTDKNSISDFITEFERKYKSLDCLVLNVGSGKSRKAGDESLEDWDLMYEVNLKSALLPLKSLESMLADGGSVVCISSICGIEYLNAPVAYSAMKSALQVMVKSYAHYFARKNIRINAVAPGNVMFKGSTWEEKIKNNKEAVLNMLNSEVPLKRFGTSAEIGNSVAFLLSDKSSFTTGEVLIVDGGQTKAY